MDGIWSDFLLKQAPVIVVLSLVGYKTFTYFSKKVEEKDEQLNNNNEKVMELYAKAIEATTRNCEVQEQLLEIIKETREDVRGLTNAVGKLSQ